MGRCDFCHEATGVLGIDHGDCRVAGKRITELVRRTALDESDLGTFQSRYDDARTASGRKVVALGPALAGWKEALETVLEDGVLSAEEESRLVSLAKPLGIEQTTAGPSWLRLGKAAVLRDVLEGKIPERVAIEGHTANLMRAERPVWLLLPRRANDPIVQGRLARPQHPSSEGRLLPTKRVSRVAGGDDENHPRRQRAGARHQPPCLLSRSAEELPSAVPEDRQCRAVQGRHRAPARCDERQASDLCARRRMVCLQPHQ